MGIVQSAERTERETLKFRLLALLVVAFTLYIRAQYVPLWPTVALVLSYLAYSLAARLLLIPRFMGLPLIYGMLAVDSLAVLATIYLIGPESPVFVLLPVLVVYYALYLGYAGSLAAATVASLGYSGITIVLGHGEELGERLAIQVPLFYLIALLVGYLARLRFKEQEEKLELQRLIEVETRARSLLHLVDSLAKGLDTSLLAQDIARMASLIAKVPYCLVLLPDEGGQRLVGKAATFPLEALGIKKVEELSEPLGGDGLIARAWREKKTISVGSKEADHFPTWAGSLGARWLHIIPLVSEEDRLGLLCLMSKEERAMGWEELEGLRAFSDAASRVLGSAQLYPSAQRRGARLLAELKQTVESLGRLRDLRGRPPIHLGNLTIEPARERVIIDGKELSLSRTEFDILYLLAERAGTVVSPDAILREVWGPDFVPQGNVVDVSIHRLRRKLASTPGAAGLIRTVRGKGYTLTLPGSPR